MYQRDFLKLANGLRADLKSCIKSRTQRSSLLFRILTYFQEYSEQERPEKYKSFAEFASNNHLEYPIGIPKVDDTSLRRIGAKISEAKQGAAPDIVPLILFYLWTETRREFLALLEEGRDLHDFIGEILDHELSSEQQSRALDVPKLLFIGAKGRGENETRDVSEIAERFTQKSMIVDVVLVDGANADAVARTLPQRIDEAQLTVICLSKAIMRKPWQQTEFQRQLRAAFTRDAEVAVLIADEPLATLVSHNIDTTPCLSLDLSYGVDKLFEELSRAFAKRRSGPDAFFQFRNAVRTKHAGMAFLETGLNPPMDSTSRSDLGLAIIDVDGISNINRNFGEAVGDAVIRRIDSTLREFIAEYGGDTGQCGDDAFYLATRGADAMSHLLTAHSRIGQIIWSDLAPGLWASVSMGVAFRDRDSREPGIDVAIRAMLGMKKAKPLGGGGCEAGPELLPHTTMFERADTLRRGFS